MSDKILINISEHNDHMVIQTILSAYKNARYKENLIFVVCSTNSEVDRSELKKYPEVNVDFIDIKSKHLIGVSLARSISSAVNMDSHDFELRIDSHMLFAQNWDDYLLNSYKKIIQDTKEKNFLISYYTNGWEIKNDQILIGEDIYRDMSEELFLNQKTYKCKMIKSNQGPIPYMIEFDGNSLVMKDYEQQYLINGHFVFGHKNIFYLFPENPYLIWQGDQELFSIRCFSKNTKIYALKHPAVWHYQTKKNFVGESYEISDPDKWIDWRKNIDDAWKAMMARTAVYLNDIFNGRSLGDFGFSSIEKMKEFKSIVGITI